MCIQRERSSRQCLIHSQGSLEKNKNKKRNGYTARPHLLCFRSSTYLGAHREISVLLIALTENAELLLISTRARVQCWKVCVYSVYYYNPITTCLFCFCATIIPFKIIIKKNLYKMKFYAKVKVPSKSIYKNNI